LSSSTTLTLSARLLSPHAMKIHLFQKSDDDVVVCAAVRTAVTRAKKGGFKDTCPEELLSAVLSAVADRARLPDKALVDDTAVGNVLPPGGGANVARMAQLHAGYPNTCPISTLNRQCSSGLTTVVNIANQIVVGQIDIGIGAGVESMTMGFGAGVMPEKMSEAVMENKEAVDCLLPMGITSENVATDYNITREEQDAFAAKSFHKAAAAQKAGKFKEEIIPVKVLWTDPKSGDEKEIVVADDDGIRDGVTAESLSKLKPVFSETGSTHAGNASQVSDGAAAVLLARRSVAKKHGLAILGKFVTGQFVGVPPRTMGVGPLYAIRKLWEKTGLTDQDIDFYEINEAFASQAVYSIKELGISFDKVNPVGGAIAIGHPLGATGSRQVATGFAEARRSGKKVFITSMCVGSGMGAAALYVAEP